MRSTYLGHRLLAAAISVACAGFLVPATSSAAPPHAVTKKTVYVDGSHLPAALRLDGRDCPSPVFQPESVPNYRVGPKGPLGSAHAEWSDPTERQAVGLATRVGDLTSFEGASVQVASLAPDGSMSGVAFASFDATASGQWFGAIDLGADQTTGWHQVSGLTDGSDLAHVGLKWYHFTPAGSVDQTVVSARIDDFAVAQGVTAGWFGFGFGCDGNGFALDGLRVLTASSDTRYNIERPRTEARLSVAGPSVVGIGGAVKLRVALRDRATNAGLAGKVQLKVSGSKSRSLAVARSGSTVTFKPTRQTSVSIVYAGTKTVAGSTSPTVTVKVRQQVAAKLSAAAVITGTTVHVRGSVNPHHAAAVVLQRKAGRSWRAVATRRTSGSGAFDFPMRTTGVGTQYLRVLAKSGGGLLENVSRTAKLVVKPKPPTGGGSGGGDGGGDGGGGGDNGGGGSCYPGC